MILYKYLHHSRLDVLRHRTIRFTQPDDFNDPFEFRPQIQAATDDVRAYVEDNFEVLVDQLLEKFHALTPILTDANVRNLLLSLRPMLPEVFRMVQTEELQRVAPAIDKLLNRNVGVLCLSEVRDSILMGVTTQTAIGAMSSVSTRPTRSFPDEETTSTISDSCAKSTINSIARR